MNVPERIAMCAHPQGEHLHVPLEAGDMLPTTCFQQCDCTPVEFVRVTWIEGEPYSVLSSRELAFNEASVQAQAEAARLREAIHAHCAVITSSVGEVRVSDEQSEARALRKNAADERLWRLVAAADASPRQGAPEPTNLNTNEDPS